MKINILYKFRDGAWGGANQFLKVLREELRDRGVYEDDSERADVIVFNSYPFSSESFFDLVFRLKLKYPDKIIIHRLTGPLSAYRNLSKEVDRAIYLFNRSFVDGNIFQSEWCKGQFTDHFSYRLSYDTVIHNAVNDNIFAKGNLSLKSGEKIKLIATSWSSNWKKGFDVFKYLDENLDFSRYEMSFLGNSPIVFNNIRHLEPTSSYEVADVLRRHHIYIFASRLEACSNALIEALSCGLPVAAIDSGSNAEVLQGGGELFNDRDIIGKIDKIVQDYEYYKSNIPDFSIKRVAIQYGDFLKKVWQDAQEGNYKPCRIGLRGSANFLKIKLLVLKWKIKTIFY